MQADSPSADDDPTSVTDECAAAVPGDAIASGRPDRPVVGRRSLLAAIGGAIAATAGCIGGGGPSATNDDWQYLEDGPDYGGWFDDAGNFEGTVDWTGRDAVSVDVGAGDRGRLFAPPAIRIDAGTTVTWEWSGAGGPHNVVAADGSFDSGDSTASGDATYEYTFEAAGTYRYVCVPHENGGMVGAVDVV